MRLIVKDFSDYRRYEHSPVEVNDLSPDDLVRLQKIGLLKIHLTPKRILAAIKMVGFAELIPIFLAFLAEAVKSAVNTKRR